MIGFKHTIEVLPTPTSITISGKNTIAVNEIAYLTFNIEDDIDYMIQCTKNLVLESLYDDDFTKTIILDCIEITDEMVTVIKIVKCDENSLHLDFDGEIRIFEK